MKRLCLLLVPLLARRLLQGHRSRRSALFPIAAGSGRIATSTLDPAFDGPVKDPRMPKQAHPEKYKEDPIVDS